MECKASLNLLAKVITVGVIMLLVVLGRNSIQALINMGEMDMSGILIHSGILLFFIAIILGIYLYSPQKYILQEDQLIIKRPIGSLIIKLDDIMEIRKMVKAEFMGTIRIFGIGGLLGNFGHIICYIPQRKNLIYIKEKPGRKIFISPNDVYLANYLKALLDRNLIEQ